MRRLGIKTLSILLLLIVLCACGNTDAAVLVQSPNGPDIPKASLAVAATAPDAAGKAVYFTTDQTLTANLVWPADRELIPLNGAKINHGTYTVSYAGSTARWPRAQVFNGTGTVTFSPNGSPEIWAQWFGQKGDGVTDDTAAINKAHASAGVSGVTAVPQRHVVRFDGYAKVTGPIIYKAPMRGVDMQASRLLTTENSGGNVILVTGIDYWDLRDFQIAPLSDTLQNFTGVKVDGTGLRGNQFYMQNVYARKAAVGFDITGFIGDMVNVKARFCTLGMKGTLLNATRLNLVLEGNTVGLDLIDSAGVQIVGGVNENNETGMKVDKCFGINIATYFEANTTHLWVGYSADPARQCANITLSSGNVVTSLVGGIKIDNVRHFTIKKDVNIQTTAINVTALAAQYDLSGYSPILASNKQYPVDLLHFASTPEKREVLNLFPNPKFIGGLRGWKSLSTVSATTSLETTTTLHGYGLKVSGVAGATYARASIRLPAPVVAYLKGKSLVVMARAFVPDLPDYRFVYDNGATNSKALPGISIEAIGGATPGQSDAISARHTVGTWNNLWNSYTIPADATDVAINFWAHRTSGAPAADFHLIFGEVILVESPTNFDAMVREFKNHPLAGRYRGLNWVGYDSAIPTGSTQTYSIGDEIENSAISLLGSYTLSGWRRVTNGTGNVLNTDWVEMRAPTGL